MPRFAREPEKAMSANPGQNCCEDMLLSVDLPISKTPVCSVISQVSSFPRSFAIPVKPWWLPSLSSSRMRGSMYNSATNTGFPSPPSRGGALKKRGNDGTNGDDFRSDRVCSGICLFGSLLRLVQSLGYIGNNVIDVLNAHRYPDQIGTHTGSFQLFFIQLSVCGGSRVAGE